MWKTRCVIHSAVWITQRATPLPYRIPLSDYVSYPQAIHKAVHSGVPHAHMSLLFVWNRACHLTSLGISRLMSPSAHRSEENSRKRHNGQRDGRHTGFPHPVDTWG